MTCTHRKRGGEKFRLPQIVFCLLFILLITLPLGIKLAGFAPKPVNINENRKLSGHPKLAAHPLSQWPALLDAWFRDHLAFRNHLLGQHIRIWEKGLEAPVHRLITGRQGEMFPEEAIAHTVFNHLGLFPLTPELILELKLGYAGTQAWFAARGIPYLLVIIPNKATLEADLLPFWTGWCAGEGRYGQLVTTLSGTGIHLLDILPVLRNRQDPLHRMHDKWYDVWHWNGNALAAAYESIGERLASWNTVFTPRPAGQHYELYPQPVEYYSYGTDTVPFLRLRHPEYLENRSSLLPKTDAQDEQILLFNREQPEHALWFMGDSYFRRTHMPWIEHCRVSGVSPLAMHVNTFISSSYNLFTIPYAQEIVTRFQPDAVVEAFVERVVGGLPSRTSNPLIRILGDSLLQTPAHLLTPDTDWNGVSVFNARLTPRNGAWKNSVIITAETNDPQLELPPIVAGKDGRVAVMARIEAPVETNAQLFFAPAGLPFREEQSAIQELKQGENLVHITVTAKPGQRLALRLDPGMAAGTYRFLPMPEEITATRSRYGF